MLINHLDSRITKRKWAYQMESGWVPLSVSLTVTVFSLPGNQLRIPGKQLYMKLVDYVKYLIVSEKVAL